MSLNAHDRQELELIEETLAGADPDLAKVYELTAALNDLAPAER